jgi:bacterioferritin
VTSDLDLSLLNRALARELQVSVQYMLQHAVEAAQQPARSEKTPAAIRSKFIGTQRMYFLPGLSLKKTAIAEMRHAEAIAERIVELGGEPTTQPTPITLGATALAMMEIDAEEERGAISLYQQIIDSAAQAGDEATRRLFQRILQDEEGHLKTFVSMLGAG